MPLPTITGFVFRCAANSHAAVAVGFFLSTGRKPGEGLRRLFSAPLRTRLDRVGVGPAHFFGCYRNLFREHVCCRAREACLESAGLTPQYSLNPAQENYAQMREVSVREVLIALDRHLSEIANAPAVARA